MRIGSLFSGIGGLELGLERAGVGRVVWQVEKEPYCRAVLAKHWPGATRYEDVREVHAYGKCEHWNWIAPEPQPCPGCLAPVDVICGGFPCQDVSAVGARAGIDGTRSGLWTEFARIVRELRPRFVVVENTAGLLDRGFGRVLGGLAALGYDAEWSVVSACSVGAPHSRQRVFLLAHSNRERQQASRAQGTAHDAAVGAGRVHPKHLHPTAEPDRVARGAHWHHEPSVGRMADGVPSRVDRLRALGNAVVPQVAEVVGRRLIEINAKLQAQEAA